MSTKYLGETFDIHGGGMDLKFPHHECEIAQATCATGKPPVKYWLHSNMLTVNGQKMSKSLGNSFLPRELISGNHPLLQKGFSPMTVRFFMLQSHYSSTLDFSNEAMVAAEKGFKRLVNALNTVKEFVNDYSAVTPDSGINDQLIRLTQECYTSMSDDFNTATTLAVLFEMSSLINAIRSGIIKRETIDPANLELLRSTYVGFMEDVLGLHEEEAPDHQLLDGVVRVLIELRKKARQDRNFTLSDKIRDDLSTLGIQLMDGKDGEVSYRIGE
jgi:cysteinyl-tRNA synthetase